MFEARQVISVDCRIHSLFADISTVTDPVQAAYLCFFCTMTTVRWQSHSSSSH